MRYDVAYRVLAGAGFGTVLAGSSSTDNLKVAFVGAFGVVIAAAVPAIAATRQKERNPYSRLMTQQREDLKKQQETIAERDKRIDELEGYLLDNDIDPRTGRPLHDRPTH